MIYLNIILTLMLLIEILNFLIRLIKIVPEKSPPLEEDIRVRMYS